MNIRGDIFYILTQEKIKEVLWLLGNNSQDVKEKITSSLSREFMSRCASTRNLSSGALCDFLKEPVNGTNPHNNILNKLLHGDVCSYLYRKLKLFGFQDVYLQGYNKFDVGDNVCDVELYYYGSESLKSSEDRGYFNNIKPGVYALVVPKDSTLKPDAITKVKKLKEKYKDAVLVVPNDTRISANVGQGVYKAGGTIVKTGLTRNEHKDRILGRRNLLQEELNGGSQKNILSEDSQFKGLQSSDIDRIMTQPIRELVSEQLDISDINKINAFIKTVGGDRIRVYAIGGVLRHFYDFVELEYGQEYPSRFIHHEVKVYFIKRLRRSLISHFSFTPAGESRNTDIIVKSNGNLSLNHACPNGNNASERLSPEEYRFIIKTFKQLRGNVVSEAIGKSYDSPNTHVLILADSIINDSVPDKLEDRNINIYRLPITRKVIVSHLFGLSEKYMQNMREINARKY